ncbi:MAG: cyclase family protein [Chloroflexi bacterium]|nr:cyclase family protein [Chloroflexota bacterium]
MAITPWEAVAGRKTYELSHPMHNDMPRYPVHPPFYFTLAKRHGDFTRGEGYSFANDVMFVSGHSGTHLDGLGHVSLCGFTHGEKEVGPLQTGAHGLNELGVETVAPILHRGVLLDVAGHRGVDCLDAAEPITARELEAVARAERVELREGDCVLVRTGWARHWSNPPKFLSLDEGLPGPDLEAARWLAGHKIFLTGSDTIVYEQRLPNPGIGHVHLALLVDAGIHIVESMALDELAADRAYEFLFVALPWRVVGATGSPIRAIAVV